MCKGSWHGAAVTEGLLPQLWFFSISKRRSRSPGFVSARQLSSVPKTALLTGSSGKTEAPGHRSVFSFPDLSRIRLRKSIPQSRFARQLPLHKGAFYASPSLPCARGGGSAVGGDERVASSAVRFPGVPVYPAALHIRDSNPSVSLRSTAPFTQGSPDCRQSYRQCIQLHGLSVERGRESPFCAQSMLIQEYF